MCLPTAESAENFVTQLTLVRFVNRVDSHVFLQIPRENKLFFTHVAFVQFLSTVSSTVFHKVT